MASHMCPTGTTCLRTLTRPMSRFGTHSPSGAAFSTAIHPIRQTRTRQRSPPTPQLNTTSPIRTVAVNICSRQASTNAPASSASTSEDVLTWDEFFNLRQKRRWINLATSVATFSSTIMIAGPLLAQADFDSWAAQMSGMDPVIVLGISTVAAGGCGWLCGPTIGNQVFRMYAGRKGWNTLVAQKEKSFYDRIKRYRADPSSSSPQNPIPDYYGEKIGSVKDYRRWLKDQRAFNLKKNKNMI